VLPFHFSTKFTDRESGLNYYGYRFYDPVDGRWLNRDPIGERGGRNLYTIVDNSPVHFSDTLGLFKIKINATGSLDVTVEGCEIVLFRGHGSADDPHTFSYPPGASDESECRRVGFYGCEAGDIMDSVPGDYGIPGHGMHRKGEVPEPDQTEGYNGLRKRLDSVPGEAELMCTECDPPCTKVRLAVLNYIEPSRWNSGHGKGTGGKWHLYQLNISCDNIPKTIPRVNNMAGWDSKTTLEDPW
jgi:RHS repeat-associated protein